MNPAELAAAFEDCSLDLKLFSHEEHLKLAWYYLGKMPVPEAMIRMRDGLLKITAHHGITGKYHETITFSLLMVIAQRREQATVKNGTVKHSTGWSSFRDGNKDLSHWRDTLAKYYCPNTLDSEAARGRFLFPDALT